VKLPLGSQAHRHLYGAKANLAQSNRSLSTQLLSYTIEPATDFLAKRLNCDIDDMLHHIVRVRFADGKPIVIEDTFMPITTITGLSREKVKGSIYDHINHDLGLKIHSATIEITAPSASSLESEHLNIPLGNSLINVEQVAYLDNGEAFEYSNVKYPCHEFRFTTNYIKL
jgi:GntR family transcriptional regulator